VVLLVVIAFFRNAQRSEFLQGNDRTILQKQVRTVMQTWQQKWDFKLHNRSIDRSIDPLYEPCGEFKAFRMNPPVITLLIRSVNEWGLYKCAKEIESRFWQKAVPRIAYTSTVLDILRIVQGFPVLTSLLRTSLLQVSYLTFPLINATIVIFNLLSLIKREK
jgi:hypothetical protein